MKSLIMLVVAMLSFASFQALVERFEKFVTEVEANYETYDEADWERVSEKHAKFKAVFKEKYDSLSDEEREAMNKGFGRYDVVVTKVKVKEAASTAKRFLKDAGEYVEGFIDGMKKDAATENSK